MISNLYDRIRLLFVTEKKPFLELHSILGFYPRNIKLYRLALMHKSVAHFEREKAREEMANSGKKKHVHIPSVNNERLEFLGDAMLGAIVADILYKHYGTKQEGFLTNLRSKIVCRRSLNSLAVKLGLDKLILHTGAVTTAHNSYMNGNAFEAFVGAIYLDRGYAYCYRFLEEKVFKQHINIDLVAKQEGNYKSMLIEWCQKYRYKFDFSQKESREGHNHSTPVFSSIVTIEGVVCGNGTGYSKKESDQKAAEQALKSVKKDQNLSDQIHKASLRQKNTQTDVKSEE